MSAHGIVQATIVISIASVLCRCSVRVHGPGSALLTLYRQHRALARQHQRRKAARPPATVMQFTTSTKEGK
jgi:hypothetical protein